MKNKYVIVSSLSVICLGLSGCQFDGGPLFDDDTDHKVHFGSPVTDSNELSLSVKRALRAGPSTASYTIDVSLVSDGNVKLSGFVDSVVVRDEAERIASGVEGVKFVVNTLFVR